MVLETLKEPMNFSKRTVTRRTRSRHVIMTDPSLFSPAYDKMLCESLNKHEQGRLRIELWGRAPRAGEPLMLELPAYKASFYLLSEKLRNFRHPFNILAQYIKALEHFLSWVLLYGVVLQTKATLHLQWLVLPFVDIIFIKLLKGKIRLILTVHDTTPFLGSPTSKIQTWRWQEALMQFDRYVVHTAASKKVLLDWGIQEESIHLSPIGSTTEIAGISRQDRGFKSILLFGSIKKYKGADLLIRAFKNIDPLIRKGWKVEIIGKLTQECTNLVDLAKELNIANEVIFDSRYIDESEIAQIAMNADIYCFPYRQIDTSGILMNFIPFGKPILASNLGVFNDLLMHEKSAYLVSPGDISALTEGLTKLIDSQYLRNQLGARAKTLNLPAEAWKQAAEVHARIYLE